LSAALYRSCPCIPGYGFGCSHDNVHGADPIIQMKHHRHPFARLVIVAAGLALATTLSFSQAIAVNGGNVTMSITAGSAGGQLVSVVNTSTTLSYQKQAALAKVSVSTSCPGQKFNLSVVALNVTKGVAASTVTLLNGSPAVDFITNIPSTGTKNASCTLQYTASSTFSQGNSIELGDDVHTITYTIQAQ
jgi:hypothetical protein